MPAAVKKGPVKLCLRCRKIKPIVDFYSNRGWKEQNFCDTICKECAKAYITDKDSARQYFWENNRVWSEKIWESAHKRGIAYLANNAEYLAKSTSSKRKAELELDRQITGLFALMNSAMYYQYVDNDPDGIGAEFNPESLAGTTSETSMTRADEELVFSDEWGGMFTKREIRYLDNYFARLKDEFVLDNVNREDYARRVALASLDANNKYQKMRQGTGTAKDWQDAQAAFDAMSKSGSFAESQRKEAANTKMNALGTIIMDIELNHHNEMPQVKFPKDDIDKILRDFGFTGEAIS